MKHLIDKPAQTTYFIVSNGKIIYGQVNPNQVMDSGLPNLETFLVKEDWISRLAELGIEYEEEGL